MSGSARKSGATKPVIRSTRRRKGGKAQPVIVVSGNTRLESGASQPIYVVDAAYVAHHGLISGAAQPVQEVTGNAEIGGRAKPVYVVSGSFDGGGGPTPPPPFVGFLDAVSNVEHVYLLFRGLSAYTDDLVRLRRDSDDAELDFTWDSTTNEFLDVAAVTAWLAGSTGNIVTIYDQTAAGDDITQGTEANQPALTLSDANFNNRPTLACSSSVLRCTFAGGSLSQPITTITASKVTSGALFDGTTSGGRMALDRSSNNWRLYCGAGLSIFNDYNANSNIFHAVANGASGSLYRNGATASVSGNTGSNSPVGFSLGSNYITGYLDGSLIGAIIIHANASNADKNIVGNKFETVYNIAYTDI